MISSQRFSLHWLDTLSSDPADQNYDPELELDDPELADAAFELAIRTIRLDCRVGQYRLLQCGVPFQTPV